MKIVKLDFSALAPGFAVLAVNRHGLRTLMDAIYD
jgi:hypothetical protein